MEMQDWRRAKIESESEVQKKLLLV